MTAASPVPAVGTPAASPTRLAFDVGGSRISAVVDELVIAGWTGRDRAAVEQHIEELRQLGIAPPRTIPVYYRAGPALLTQAAAVQVLGQHSSGEAEVVLVGTDEGVLLALGSDHTDRRVEAYSVSVSKQLCPKPVSRRAWRLAEVRERWDSLVLEAHIWEGGRTVVYQRGTLASLRPPDDLVAGLTGAADLPPRQALFCGTLAAIGGIRPASRFAATLTDPATGATLSLAYDIHPLIDVLEDDNAGA